MLEGLVQWYHHATIHAFGTTHLYTTIPQLFFHPKLHSKIRRQIEPCDLCQRLKHSSCQYGELAPHNAPVAPWQMVAVDYIGPWVIALALTTIDIITNLLEIEYLSTKTSLKCGHSVKNNRSRIT